MHSQKKRSTSIGNALIPFRSESAQLVASSYEHIAKVQRQNRRWFVGIVVLLVLNFFGVKWLYDHRANLSSTNNENADVAQHPQSSDRLTLDKPRSIPVYVPETRRYRQPERALLAGENCIGNSIMRITREPYSAIQVLDANGLPISCH